MDILIKIIIYRYDYYRKKYIEKLTKDIKIDDNKNIKKVIFEFNEYDKIGIKLIKSNFPIYIETYSNDEVLLDNCNEIIISAGGDSDSLVPGQYNLIVDKPNERIEFLFNVNPKNIKLKELLDMREILEKICNGLSKDIYKERLGLKESDLNKCNIDFEAYNYLYENFGRLIYSMRSIIKNPINTIYNNYKVGRIVGKQDYKTSKWLNKKGIIKKNKFLSKHTYLESNIKENIIIKDILINILYFLDTILNEFNYCRYNINNKIRNSNDKMERLQYRKLKSNGLAYVKRKQYEISRDCDIIQKDIKCYKKRIHLLNVEISKILSIKYEINNFLNNSWIKYVQNNGKELVVSKSIYKNNNYYCIYDIYRKMFYENSQRVSGKRFALKKSSILYEIYCFIIIKDILEKMDYEWVDGWMREKHDKFVVGGDLESGDYVIMIKDNIKIEMFYDIFIDRASDVIGSDKSKIVSSNSERRRPDILISLYKDDVFIKSMIVEVKYRRKCCLYDKDIETDIIHQLKEYRNLDFYDGINKKIDLSRPIQKVITIFPDDKEEVIKEEIYGFIFLSLKPKENLRNSTLGYQNLYNEISSFVKI